jgi:mRNA-degrading endonuclease RelE of RelBE toxin-antitoxin system
MTHVEISLTARDTFESLPQERQDRIKTKLLGEVADDPERHLRSLTNSSHDSIRVDQYRLVVDYDNAADRLKIHDVGHRRSVYD